MLRSQQPNYVCERKFSGPATALERVAAILEGNCTPDDYFAEGFVNSIYFDTPGFSSYSEKANGDNIKTKIRLRWYGRDAAIFKIKSGIINQLIYGLQLLCASHEGGVSR